MYTNDLNPATGMEADADNARTSKVTFKHVDPFIRVILVEAYL